jgi:hypothetical protein
MLRPTDQEAMNVGRVGWGRASLAALATVAAVATSCLPASAAGAHTTTAAAHPLAWHVVYREPGYLIEAIAATGPKNAWAVGLDDRHGSAGLLLHWNGSNWRRVTFPGQRSFLPIDIYAVSSTDFWLTQFATTAPTRMLHWNKGQWSSLVMPVNAEPLVAIGDHDVWASDGSPTLSHWDGSTWTDYSLAAHSVASAAASSPASVWAVGELNYVQSQSTFRPVLFRWTGSGWQRSSLVGPRTTYPPSALVYSPRDVYVAEASTSHPRACAMHWSGSRWSPLYLPGSSGSCNWLTSDYQHGFWVSAPPTYGYGFIFVHWTGRRFVSAPGFLASSRSYDGSASIAAIPQSRSVWAYGAICTPIVRHCVSKATIAILR